MLLLLDGNLTNLRRESLGIRLRTRFNMCKPGYKFSEIGVRLSLKLTIWIIHPELGSRDLGLAKGVRLARKRTFPARYVLACSCPRPISKSSAVSQYSGT